MRRAWDRRARSLRLRMNWSMSDWAIARTHPNLILGSWPRHMNWRIRPGVTPSRLAASFTVRYCSSAFSMVISSHCSMSRGVVPRAVFYRSGRVIGYPRGPSGPRGVGHLPNLLMSDTISDIMPTTRWSTPYGSRTRVFGLRIRRPGPLDEGGFIIRTEPSL